MCRTHGSATQTKCQGHSSRSWDFALIFVSAAYLLDLFNCTQMFLSVTQGQGNNSKSWELPLVSFPRHISWTLWTIFIKLYPNVSLIKTIYKTHNSATQTQGQGLTSKSWYLPLTFVSTTLWKFFIKLQSSVPLTEMMCRLKLKS